MLALLKYWQIGAGAVLGAMLAVTPVYFYGKHAGMNLAAIMVMENSIRILRERGATDEEISASSLAGMCAHFELPDEEQRECVRRLEKADAESRNSR